MPWTDGVSTPISGNSGQFWIEYNPNDTVSIFLFGWNEDTQLPDSVTLYSGINGCGNLVVQEQLEFIDDVLMSSYRFDNLIPGQPY